MSLRAVIVDDMDLDCFNLRVLLKHCPGVTCIAECSTVEQGVTVINEQRPNLVFLDVQMPTGSGFDVLEHLAYTPSVIFVTAFDQFAIKAFEVNAVDYLLKPILLERLQVAVARVTAARGETMRATTRALTTDERILLKGPARQYFVQVSKIAAICAAGDYSEVHVLGQAPMEVRRRMSAWLETLPPDLFVQVDRSLIVNRTLIRSIERESRTQGRLTITGLSTPIPIGRVGLERLQALAESD